MLMMGYLWRNNVRLKLNNGSFIVILIIIFKFYFYHQFY